MIVFNLTHKDRIFGTESGPRERKLCRQEPEVRLDLIDLIRF